MAIHFGITAGAAFAIAALASTLSQNTYADPITYVVNQKIGPGGVTGSIETDGKIGVVSLSNITHWNLRVTLGINAAVVDLVGPKPPSSKVTLVGGDMSATEKNLSFNFSGPDSGRLCFTTLGEVAGFGLGTMAWCLGAIPPSPRQFLSFAGVGAGKAWSTNITLTAPSQGMQPFASGINSGTPSGGAR